MPIYEKSTVTSQSTCSELTERRTGIEERNTLFQKNIIEIVASLEENNYVSPEKLHLPALRKVTQVQQEFFRASDMLWRRQFFFQKLELDWFEYLETGNSTLQRQYSDLLERVSKIDTNNVDIKPHLSEMTDNKALLSKDHSSLAQDFQQHQQQSKLKANDEQKSEIVK